MLTLKTGNSLAFWNKLARSDSSWTYDTGYRIQDAGCMIHWARTYCT